MPSRTPGPGEHAEPLQLHLVGRQVPTRMLPPGEAQIVHSQRIEVARARDAGAAPLTLAAADDDVVRVEFADGLAIWSRADDLVREHARPQVGRSGAGGGWTLDAQVLPERRAEAPLLSDSRGALGLAIQALELFGVDVSGATAIEFGRRFERRRLGREPGLYRISLDAAAPRFDTVDDSNVKLPSEAPLLVFLHGTMSSLLGSFGDLWSDTPGATMPRDVRAELRERFADRVYAFEHRSLTESPVANALALVRQLPARAQLHLVSHSRGGLVGELICLAQRDLDRGDVLADALEAGLLAQERTQFDELVQLLDEKKPTIARFVRVACPARGTTLASGRLDRWLSVLGMIAPSGLASDLTDFLLKVVKERTDPRSLPGLEAMMPGSALMRLLHWPGLSTQADLSVISGDLDPEGRWGKLKLLALDWFYSSDHDLIVNTGSMSGGVERVAGRARQRSARGPRVHHFSYFANPDSREWLLGGLLRAEGESAGYGALEPWSPAVEPRSRSALRASRLAGPDRPIALIVPGALGSSLLAEGRPVWLDHRALFFGAMGRITIDARDVEPGDLLDALYAPLIEDLATTHAVHALPYDWRRSVRETAARLTRKLEELLPLAEGKRVPLRIVAHSMGGLVARSLLADPAGRAAWQRWAALPGSRLLMLGTPNAGSHEAMRWFTGFNPTLARLALLDVSRGPMGLVDIVRRYPGLAELLPTGAVAGPHDHHDPAFWAALRAQLGAAFPAAEHDVLAPARATWQALAEHPLPAAPAGSTPPFVVYVAGQQPATVIGHQVVEDPWMNWRNELQFIATPHGDGTVSWQSGRLPGVPMYLARGVAHDDLCSDTETPELFAGYRELLETGRTTRLPPLPGSVQDPLRSGASEVDEAALHFVFREPAPDTLPDPATLRASGFGARAPRAPRAPKKTPRRPLRITVQNRNLKFLDQPLLIGHYASSRLTSTEAIVDRQIGGAMSQSLAAGRYPEAPGTHQIFRNRRLDILLPGQLPRPAAVIVVGLGAEGQLRFTELTTTIRQAVIAYAQQRLEDPVHPVGGDERDFAIAATLIGSGGLGIETGTAAQAIALGIQQANRRLAQAGTEGWPRVQQLHLVELYLDRATEAFHALQVLASADADAFALDPALRIDIGAKRRTVDSGYRGAKYDWISALTVRDDSTPSDPAPASPDAAAARKAIAFTLSTRRARSEVRATRAQWPLLHCLVSDASNSASQDRELGRALFRLVIPAEIETFLGGNSSERSTDLVIELDDGTAGIPWELLDGRADGDTGMPWAIRTRLLRRLHTPVGASDAIPHDASAEDDILVIGEPEVDLRRYGPLPGARREAEEVVRQLTGANGLERRRVHACIAPEGGIGPDARCVITQLLARDYRALHVAGHGEPGPDGGVVLSHQSVLGPREVRAMRRIPELVFLNCCHLARGAAGDLLQVPSIDRVGFAAGLARALIGSGVRCVIAAGWAVEDEPAAEFAARFYQQLLAGRRFIDAVAAARLHTWRRFPLSNTWAAYQCYGDPDWVWRQQVGDAQQPVAGPREALSAAIASPPDLALALENLALDVRFGDQQRQRALDTLEALATRYRDGWGRIGAVADAFGTAYLGCGALAEAADWFARALQAEDGSASVKAFDQLANVRARAAAQRPPEQARAEIGATIDLLQRADDLQPTLERRNLLGSAYKRLALLELASIQAAQEDIDQSAAIAALTESAAHYTEAERRATGRTDSFYPSLNRIAVDACLDLLIDPTPRRSADALGCDAVLNLLQQRNRDQPDFWSIAGVAELQVINAMMGRRLADELPAVLRALGDLHDRQPAPNQWASVRDQSRLVLWPYLRRVRDAEAAAARELLVTLERWCH